MLCSSLFDAVVAPGARRFSRHGARPGLVGHDRVEFLHDLEAVLGGLINPERSALLRLASGVFAAGRIGELRRESRQAGHKRRGEIWPPGLFG